MVLFKLEFLIVSVMDPFLAPVLEEEEQDRLEWQQASASPCDCSAPHPDSG